MAQIDLATETAPATPGAGRRAFYFDTNGIPRYKDTTGATHSMGGLPDVYSVTDFGLVGDDSTDNVTAMNALLVTAAAGSPQGATIYFPAGVYRFATEIAIAVDKRFRFLGSGRGRSIIKTTSATANIFNVSVAGYYISWEQLGFTASVTKTAGAGIVANQNNAYLLIEGCEFQAMFNGVSFSSGALNVGYVNNTQFTAPAANGTQITLNSTGINTSMSNVTVNCTGVAGATGIRVSACGAFNLTGSDIIGGQNAFLIDQVGACQAIFCANTYFDQSTTGATVKITGSGGANRIKFTQCGITNGANGQNAMEISGTGATTAIPDGIDILGCDIYNNSFTGTTNGILITGARGVSVRESRISGFTNGINATSYSAAGVTLLDIQGNIIGPTENFAGNGTGILINAGSFTYGAINIQGNQLQGNTTAPLTDSSSAATAGQQKIVSGNLGLACGSASSIVSTPTFTTTATALQTFSVPANGIRAGTTLRVKLAASQSASGAVTIKLYYGANGTTADTNFYTLIGPVTVTAATIAYHEVLVTFRSSTTVLANGYGWGGTTNVVGSANTATTAITSNVGSFLTVGALNSAGTGTPVNVTVEVVAQ